MSEKMDVSQTCGIVMPISAIDSCSEEHWLDVRLIVEEAIDASGFTPQLVSASDDVGIIQKRIIQNLYENPILVCDVSGKNPNVMFELGMRLAFDKPTIIIKDDKTSYSFDTAPIEHLTYPRDLRFSKIVEFKDALAEKIKATYKRSIEDSDYTTFLKNFGKFKTIDLQTEVVPQSEILLDEIRAIRELVMLSQTTPRAISAEAGKRPLIPVLCLMQASQKQATSVVSKLNASGFEVPELEYTAQKHYHLKMGDQSADAKRLMLTIAKDEIPEARWLPIARKPA